MSDKIKLSPKQKDVILYMKKPGAALIYRPSKKRFYWDGKSLSAKECDAIQEQNLIEVDFSLFPDTFWKLTEKGKAIDLGS